MDVWKADLGNKRILNSEGSNQSKNKEGIVILADKGIGEFISAKLEYRVHDKGIQKHARKIRQLQRALGACFPDVWTGTRQIEAEDPFPGPIPQHGNNGHAIGMIEKPAAGDQNIGWQPGQRKQSIRDIKPNVSSFHAVLWYGVIILAGINASSFSRHRGSQNSWCLCPLRKGRLYQSDSRSGSGCIFGWTGSGGVKIQNDRRAGFAASGATVSSRMDLLRSDLKPCPLKGSGPPWRESLKK